MSLYVISDLHLSFGTNKPMDIFSGWSDYVKKVECSWRSDVKDGDTVVVPGDVSWGINLDEARADFEFINNLPGRKIFLKGNHDYYFSTKNKMDNFFKDNGFENMYFLFNNSYECGKYSICGTRGWVNEPGKVADKKVLEREAGRLKFSLDSANKEPIVFLHYPPIYGVSKTVEILNVLNEYKIKRVYYGHLHGKSCQYAIEGNLDGIDYKLVSSDYLKFKLLKIF